MPPRGVGSATSTRHLVGDSKYVVTLYLATDLRPADEDRLGADEDERLLADRIPFAEALAAAERGEIHDAKSLVALLWLARLRSGEGGPA